MSLSADDYKEGGRSIEKLDRSNWTSWIEHVKDYILALDHDDAADIWKAYIWKPKPDVEAEDQDDPADRDWQEAASAPARKLRVKHNKAYKFIRDHLSQRMFNTTKGMETNVPKLLRFLKKTAHSDGGVFDRNLQRDHFRDMKLEDYEDYEAYSTAFSNAMLDLQEFDSRLIGNDEELLYQFNKGLPSGWQSKKDMVLGQAMTFEQARSFYAKFAKSDPLLPGSSAKTLSKTIDQTHFSVLSRKQETCRKFAKGLCKNGHKCNYLHPDPPTQQEQRRPHQAEQPHPSFGGDCFYCGKRGHKKFECKKKKADEAGKHRSNRRDRTHLTREDEKSNAEPAEDVFVDSVTYVAAEAVPNAGKDNAGLRGTSLGTDGRHWIIMAVDGASTCGVVESDTGCRDVRPADVWIKTGGNGKPNFVHCTKIGKLPLDTIVDGRRVEMQVPVRIVPGFGCNILPECFFLRKGFAVNKLDRKLEVLTPDKKTVLRAEATKFDKSWLFYTKLRLAQAGEKSSGTSSPAIDTTHFMGIYEGELERQSLLPISDDYDKCYRKSCLIDSCHRVSDKARAAELVQLWHERLGHRNMQDVCDLLNIPLPPNLPKCISCIKCKSKRQPLTGSGGLHDAIRPGYAFAADHAGPFRVRSWGGHTYFSLKVDVCSGKIFGAMVVSTGTFCEEWIAHALQLEAHFGRQVIARMITDSAPYFLDRRLVRFNAQKGIVHVQSPAYTQELNGLAERTFGTIFSMARTSLDTACAPEAAHGECLMAMCEVLDVCPHKAGGKLTRLEKWHGRLLPHQHDRIKTWGCAAYLHLDYGKRGTIGSLSKLDPRAELHMFVGYDPNGMGYRIVKLPSTKVRTALHVTFVESHFPCKTTFTRDLPSFLTSEQEQRYGVDADTGERRVDADTGERGRGGRAQRAGALPQLLRWRALQQGPLIPLTMMRM